MLGADNLWMQGTWKSVQYQASLANTRLRLNLMCKWGRVWRGAVHFLVFEAGSTNVDQILLYATGQTYSQSYQRYTMSYSEPVGSSMNTSCLWRKSCVVQVFVLFSKWTCLPIYLAHNLLLLWVVAAASWLHAGWKQSRSTSHRLEPTSRFCDWFPISGENFVLVAMLTFRVKWNFTGKRAQVCPD